MEGCTSTVLCSCFALLFILTCLILTSQPVAISAASLDPNSTSIMDFIKTSCAATRFPKVCIESLSAYANDIQTSPKELVRAALTVSLTSALTTSAMVSKMLTRPDMRPKEVDAIRDCVENMNESVDELKQSMGEMSHLDGPDFDMQMNNIQTWVSAALTDADTCMDGLAEGAVSGNVKKLVRNRIMNVAQLTSNALALINSLASSQLNLP